MIDDNASPISAALANEIEDAIMFGKARDLEFLLEKTSDDALPPDVRQGLESLQYFRAHYSGMSLDDNGKRKVTLMDSSWAMELLNKIRGRSDAARKLA